MHYKSNFVFYEIEWLTWKLASKEDHTAVLVWSTIECLAIFLMTIWQVYYLKKILEDKRVI